MTEIVPVPGSCMITVRMGDDRSVNRLPGVDVKIPLFAKEPFISK